MKVKIGNRIYDAADEPIMIILSKEERLQIHCMASDATKYCQYPKTEEWIANGYAKIKEWMEVETTKEFLTIPRFLRRNPDD